MPLRTVNRGTLKAPAVLAAADVSPFFGTRGDQRFRWEGTTLVVPLRTINSGALAPAALAAADVSRDVGVNPLPFRFTEQQLCMRKLNNRNFVLGEAALKRCIKQRTLTQRYRS